MGQRRCLEDGHQRSSNGPADRQPPTHSEEQLINDTYNAQVQIRAGVQNVEAQRYTCTGMLARRHADTKMRRRSFAQALDVRTHGHEGIQRCVHPCTCKQD
eukprot:2624445-Lingulodinium_polyedra.AAC.1